MAVYMIADIPVEYECKFDLLKSRSEKYKAPEGTKPYFTIEIPREYYEKKHGMYPKLSDEIIEYMGVSTAFYKKLLSYNGMMIHASAVAYKGNAYLFSAPSKTGKSTHTEMWQKVFGKENALIINDDKPAIRKINGVYYAFGTPFSGKYDISINRGFPIKGICFIRRSDKNEIHHIDMKTAMIPLMNMTIRPVEEGNMDLLCSVADGVLKKNDFYAFDCTPEESAAEVAYNAMKGGKLNENQA